MYLSGVNYMFFSFKNICYSLFILSMYYNNSYTKDIDIPHVIQCEYNNQKCKFVVDNWNAYSMDAFTKLEYWYIHDTAATKVYYINIAENNTSTNYLTLLSILINNKKQLNNIIFEETRKFECIEKSPNYLQLVKTKLLFNIIFDNVLYKMLNSNNIMHYNLEELINQFRINIITNDNNNEKLDKDFKRFQEVINSNGIINNNTNDNHPSTNTPIVNKNSIKTKTKIFNIIKQKTKISG